jgi:N-acetylneuraminic acid mutarotase
MVETAGTIERLALELARALTDMGSRMSGDRLLDVLAELGTAFPPALLTSPQVSAAQQTLGATTAGLDPVVKALLAAIDTGNTGEVLAQGAALLARFGQVSQAYLELGGALDAVGPTLPGVTPQQVAALTANLPRKLLDLAILGIVDPAGRLTGVLGLFGLAEVAYVNADPANPTTVDHQQVALRLDRLPAFVLNPADLLRQRYGWGGAGLDGERLLRALHDLVASLGLPALFEPAVDGQPPRLEAWAFDLGVDGDAVAVSVVMPVGVSATSTVAVSPPTWLAQLSASGVLPPGTSGRLRPPFHLELSPPGGSAELRGEVTLSGVAPQPVVVLGTAGGSRLEFTGVKLTAGLALAYDGGTVTGSPTAAGEVTGARLVIDASAADGFLKTLFGAGRVEAEFGVGFTFAPETGLRFHGGAGLEIQIPVHVELGPLEVQAIYLVAGLNGSGLPIELSAGVSAQLGPVKAVVDRVGARIDLGFPDGGGNLGPADLAFAFKPPAGAGLSLDLAVVSGGGFLAFDAGREEYAGALELEFADFLELKAIGLISTRMPDGSVGFSLLIVITAEFGGGGIQLGYGFRLLAVGGLIGLNRRMNLQALVEGVRTGRIESVMFPQDVVVNAPRILSDLRAFFPPEQGKFLIGPMAKIGWGTPTLVSVSLGVIIEIPGNIAILGVLKCVLPTQELPLLVLQVDFIGAIEFDKSRLWFFAQLFDSRILTMTIDGGMGLLIGWGDNADLVLTVGGFHPSFKPPPLPFPVPNRLSVDIINQPGRLIRVSGYFAITSNTVQFGARAELRLGFDDFGIEGHLAFDALFRFSPFAFVISISAAVTLKAFGVGLLGIDLRLQLEGPAPWRARGRGSITLLFFEISADFDITWGEEQNPTLPPVEVLPLLANEISKLEGWQTRLPTGGTKALVTLRTLSDTDQLVLHPLGALFIRQRAIPLDVRLDRVGAQRPSDGKQFSVAPEPDSGLVRASITGDKFAMAQFQDMDDAAKLSRPAYEVQDAGLELTAAAGTLASVRAVRRSTRYELHIIDSKTGQARVAARAAGQVRRLDAAASPPKRTYSVSPAVFNQLLQGASTSRSPLSRREAQLRQPFAASDTVQVTVQRFVVVYARNNLQAFPPSGGGTVASFRSQTTALDALAAWVDADPSLAGNLQVVPEAEVAGPLATPGTWSAAGPAPSAAAGAGAVRLGSGKVFVTGGADGAGKAVAAAALFDPIGNTWAATQAPPAGRRLHSATKLPDGRVLVAGGIGADGTAMSAAEIYDPVADSWSPAGDLRTARFAHSAMLLTTKMVLIAGGTGARGTQGDGTLSSAELFDPETGEWSDAAAMTDARSGHQAVSARGDRVLVIGGALATGGRAAPLAYCELYDPVADTWTPAGSLNTPRVGHQATALADGSVLVVGGDPTGIPAAGVVRSASLESAERYDPARDVWKPVRSMPGGRGRHRSVLLRSGKVLVIGGTGGPAFAAGYRNVTTYDPATGTWTTTGGMATGRSDFATIELADGRVLVTGGLVFSGAAAPGPDAGLATATTEIFTP